MKNLFALNLIAVALLACTPAIAQTAIAPRSTVSFGRTLLDAENLIKANPEWALLGVKGESMTPLLGRNSLILYRPVLAREVSRGMLVVFIDQAGDRVVHQAVRRENGKWITKGLNNWKADPEPLSDANLLGAVVAVMHADASPDRMVFTGSGAPLEYALGKRR